MTSKLFSELGLSPELLKAIDKLGFEQASPIQAVAIPPLMEGLDIVGQSQTGSGKTAAFGVPAVEKVDVNLRVVQVLILCPTRELAVQVSEEIHKLALFKRGIHALPIYGGQSYERQFYGLKQGAQIVIGTPGRIMDHMRRGTLRLDTVKMAILDEADVMLNMGFRDDIEMILKSVPAERQTVFFSATMPAAIRDLIQKYSRNPKSVKIEQKAMTVPTVEQVYYEVDRRYKIELLTRLIDIHDLKLGIIFCNTKRMVDDLVEHLEAQGYMADRLHGDMTQNMRDRVMNKFRKSGLEFLVATDVAARGIDVDDVQVVFNYDLPYDGEDYVHRIGRTGRKGRSGRAISFASGREVFQIRNIERYTNIRMIRGTIPSVNQVEEARANVFLHKLRATLTTGEFKRNDHLIERLLEEGFASTDIASALIHMLQGGESAPARPQRPEEEGPADRPADRPGRQDRPERGGGREAPRGRYDERSPQRPDRDQRPARGPSNYEQRSYEQRPQRPAPAYERRGAPEPQRPRRTEYAAPDRGNTPVRPTAARPPVPAPAARPRPAAVPKPPTPAKPQAAAVAAPAPEAKPAGEKTFSDKEILGSIKMPEAQKSVQAKPAPKAKASRATPADQTRLWINVGDAQGIKPIDIVNVVAGETGLPGKVVGTVDVRERHVFVDVSTEHANSIISKLKRAEIKGQKIKVKLA
ncbi:MAG: DEAD/DEAH box helicase [Verrucomicrobia bacterium]|nr:DEAD/DEAH box helicase [Verrucomicrobiota bacterium]